jgi:hypothetical protein
MQIGKLSRIRIGKQRAKQDARIAKLNVNHMEDSKVVEDESIAFSDKASAL